MADPRLSVPGSSLAHTWLTPGSRCRAAASPTHAHMYACSHVQRAWRRSVGASRVLRVTGNPTENGQGSAPSGGPQPMRICIAPSSWRIWRSSHVHMFTCSHVEHAWRIRHDGTAFGLAHRTTPITHPRNPTTALPCRACHIARHFTPRSHCTQAPPVTVPSSHFNLPSVAMTSPSALG